MTYMQKHKYKKAENLKVESATFFILKDFFLKDFWPKTPCRLNDFFSELLFTFHNDKL